MTMNLILLAFTSSPVSLLVTNKVSGFSLQYVRFRPGARGGAVG
jgi:hypothetical protein